MVVIFTKQYLKLTRKLKNCYIFLITDKIIVKIDNK